MPHDKRRPGRISIRLPRYDYTQPGWYFVTICTHRRLRLFAQSSLRAIAESQWSQRERWCKRTAIDAFVVMDDHVHALIEIRAATAGWANAGGGWAHAHAG
ncbi:MAG: hypothetical protein H7Y32_20030, partial [Chloroflexales bacterium]|nr:hypothetical protein [Chloroflexales bacterium]